MKIRVSVVQIRPWAPLQPIVFILRPGQASCRGLTFLSAMFDIFHSPPVHFGLEITRPPLPDRSPGGAKPGKCPRVAAQGGALRDCFVLRCRRQGFDQRRRKWKPYRLASLAAAGVDRALGNRRRRKPKRVLRIEARKASGSRMCAGSAASTASRSASVHGQFGSASPRGRRTLDALPEGLVMNMVLPTHTSASSSLQQEFVVVHALATPARRERHHKHV